MRAAAVEEEVTAMSKPSPDAEPIGPAALPTCPCCGGLLAEGTRVEPRGCRECPRCQKVWDVHEVVRS